MTTYGRDDTATALARSKAPVVVLTGDSGVGKSVVLQAAQAYATAEGQIAPPPRTVRHSGGILQVALLQALGDAVVLIVERQGRASQVANLLGEAAKRLARDRGQELAKVIGKELLSIVRGRLGPDAGKAFEDYAKHLKSAADENLAARLTAAVDPGVAALIVDFAGDVCDLVGDGYVMLALDAGERLRDEDLRLLADLQETLPAGLRVRVAFSTNTTANRTNADFLCASGAAEVPVSGLGIAVVAQWLSDEALDEAMAGDVQRVTGGYPLHVGDLVAHVQAGGSVQDAPLNELFAKRTKEAWHGLDVDVAKHARSLCVLVDPLPADRLPAFLGLDSAAYGEVEDRLWRSRIFSVDVNGQRWFHEQRRRFLSEVVLGHDERGRACERAADEVYALLNATNDRQWLAPLAGLVRSSSKMLQRDEKLAVAAALSPDELALAAALIELVEPQGSRAVDGDGLLRYAKSTFGADRDLIASLRTLEKRGLAMFVTDAGAALVAPRWHSGLVGATLAGRAATELRRMPIPQAASAVFAEVAARARPFTKACYGFGSPSAATLSRYAVDLRQPEPRGAVLGSPGPGSNLLVRGDFAGRPLYAAITFPDESARDTAQSQLAGLAGQVFGEQFSVADVFAHPSDVVASRRFLNAAERLAGPLGQMHSSGSVVLRRAEALGVEDAVRLKAQALATVRARMASAERAACGLERPIGYVLFAEEGHSMEIQIVGSGGGLQLLKTPPDVSWDDPFETFRLSQAIALGPHEYLGHRAFRGGPPSTNDPVVGVLSSLQQQAADFNRHQQKKHVVLDAVALQAELIAAAHLQFDDARALAEAVPIGDEPRVVEAWTTHLVIYLDPPDPGLVPGGYSRATVTHAPSPTGEEEVHVEIVHRQPGEPPRKREADLPKNVLLRRRGDMHHILAGLLGHTEGELSFAYPDENS